MQASLYSKASKQCLMIQILGHPTTYDVCIINNPEAGPNRYSVIGKPKKPLSASDLVIQSENTAETLVRRTTPPSYEKFQERISAILEEIGGTSGSSATSEDSSDTDDDDDQNFFQNYDTKKKSA